MHNKSIFWQLCAVVLCMTIVACDGGGNSKKPPESEGLPGKPGAIGAAPLAGGAALFFWSPPSSAGDAEIGSYRLALYRSQATGVPVFDRHQDLHDPRLLRITVRNLLPGVQYVATVSARNALGQGPESDFSETIGDRRFSVPEAPRILSAEGIGNGVRLTWEAAVDPGGSLITGYRILVVLAEPRNDYSVFMREYNGLARAGTISLLPGDDPVFAISAKNVRAFSEFSPYTAAVEVLPVCPDSFIGVAAAEFSPAVPGGPYATVLNQCVLGPLCSDPSPTTCTGDELPLIGQRVDTPDVDTVMQHVLVYRPWMANRFREVLQSMHPDALLLLKATTSIVIGGLSDSVGGFYEPGTATVYVHANQLAITEEQRLDLADIADPPDDVAAAHRARSAVGARADGFQFRIPHIRLSKGTDARSILNATAGQTLLHEAMHALDARPFATIESIDRSQPMAENYTGFEMSSYLTSEAPLTSDTMAALAAVEFSGAKITPELRALTPADVAREFAPKGAVTFFGHTNRYEDLATLMDHVWAWHAQGTQIQVGVVNKAGCGGGGSSLVYYGARNRVLEPQVRRRAELILDRFMPTSVSARIKQSLDRLPGPQYLARGSNWCNQQR